jgi:uncharacterized protein
VASKFDLNRRGFLKGAALLGATPLIPGGRMANQNSQAQQIPSGEVPKRSLGKTGVQVSAMALGGYHLGSAQTDSSGGRDRGQGDGPRGEFL